MILYDVGIKYIIVLRRKDVKEIIFIKFTKPVIKRLTKTKIKHMLKNKDYCTSRITQNHINIYTRHSIISEISRYSLINIDKEDLFNCLTDVYNCSKASDFPDIRKILEIYSKYEIVQSYVELRNRVSNLF